MKYPALSELEPEQLQAIGEAKSRGSSLFRREWITYIIAEKSGHSVVMARDTEGNDAGYISTSWLGKHYAIEVPSEFRWRWIGTTLLRTKEALDGILSHDWSGRYSRIYFLIKKGYIPFAKASSLESTSSDEPLTQSDIKMLITFLREHVDKRLSWDSLEDISPLVFRMKYSPGKARKFLQENKLE